MCYDFCPDFLFKRKVDLNWKKRGWRGGGAETLSFCNQDFRCVFLNIRHYQFIADAELEKSGNLGTRFLVHFRPKFGK